jgi:hypothetical protein
MDGGMQSASFALFPRLAISSLVQALPFQTEPRMNGVLQPLVFTLDVGQKPVLTFEAKNLREAHEICHEHWLLADLKQMTCDGSPLWDGKTRLRARYAVDEEKAAFRAADGSTSKSEDDLPLVFLIALDREPAE